MAPGAPVAVPSNIDGVFVLSADFTLWRNSAM
jgi:hypothetical protein